MLKPNKTIGTVIIIGIFIAALAGCHKEGPAEKAGKAADNAVDKTGQQIEKAGDSVQDAAKGKK
jgi:hypothetical protein